MLRDYGVLALGRGTLHSYTLLGWVFEVLTVLAGILPLGAAAYGGVVPDRTGPAAVAVLACGALALGVVIVASITFEIADPRSDGSVIGSDMRLGPGAVAAAVSAVAILAGGLITRREVADYR